MIRETRQQVQGRLGAIRDASGANDPHRPDFWTKPRPQHILTGKLFCGSCGGVFGNSGRDYLACNAAKKQAVCDNHRTIRRQVLEDIVLDALRARLMEPSLVALFTSEFTVEWNRLQADAGAGRAQQERELAQTPTAEGDGLEVDATGKIAAMLAVGMAGSANANRPAQVANVPSLSASSVKVVAGTGFGRQLTPLRTVC